MRVGIIFVTLPKIMTIMKYFFSFVSALLLFASCSSNDGNSDTPTTGQRTVVVYMSGENRLSKVVQEDIDEMITGAKNLSDDNRLVIFVDRASTKEKPFLARIDMNSTKTRLDTLYTYPADFYASSADNFREVLQRATSYCPAKEYGLVLWGHASGWLIENDSIPATANAPGRRAYGVDNGNNDPSTDVGKWMNIPTMRAALQALGIKFQFIFADCCNMMCIENAYELRNVTNYMIGAPSEIPGLGAPYNELVPAFFKSGSSLYTGIINSYYETYIDYYNLNTSISVQNVGEEKLSGYSVPLSVINTQYLSDLAKQTKAIIDKLGPTYTYPNAFELDNMPHYLAYKGRVMYDMKAFINKFASEADYTAWLKAYNQAVPLYRPSLKWMTIYSNLYYSFSSFNQDESVWGCVSMFVPQNDTNYTAGTYAYNKNATKLEWNRTMGWSNYGW